MTNEEIFEQKMGMTLEKAWEKVQQWQASGEHEKAKQGAKMIVELFPDHPAQIFLKESVAPNVFEEQSSVVSISQKEEVVKKTKKNLSFSETMHFLITGKKPIKNEESNEDTHQEKLNEGRKTDSENFSVLPEMGGEKFSPEKIVEISGISFQKTKQLDKNLPDENEILDDERMFAGISYIPFISFFTLFSRKDSVFVQFHAWQAFSLLAVIIGSLFPYFLFGWIPGVSGIFWLYFLLLFVLSVVCMSTAWKGRYIYLPVLSSLAHQLSGKGNEKNT